MKRELNNVEIKELEKAIRKFLKSRTFESNNNIDQFRYITTYKQIDYICGLAYTSSSSFAGLFVCNIILYFDIDRKYKINGFGMRSSGRFFADIINIETGTDSFLMYI